MNLLNYALISPVKNEGKFIGNTIEAVMAQTVLPTKWVIVSDGSTDETDRVVLQYCRKCDFMELVRTENKQRDFGAKVAAFNIGIGHLSLNKIAYIGNLDGDVTFEPRFFERLLSKFNHDGSLGAAGGFVLEREADCYRARYGNVRDSVPGAVLIFRAECYKQTGGYAALKWGGEDVLIQLVARELGWHVEAFSDLPVFHLKKRDSGVVRSVCLRFGEGRRSWSLGYLPLYMVGKAAKRVLQRPRFIGSLSMLIGYITACIVSDDRAPRSSRQYLQREQDAAIRRLMTGHRME